MIIIEPPSKLFFSNSKEHNYINTEADVAYAPVVGSGRDTILNLLPNQNTQNRLTQILASAFGHNFKLWNSQKKEVPFHVTIAQTDKLNLKLANINSHLEGFNDVSTLAI
ncbi:hypothetical protein ACQUW5_13060 [Legionella sp. CNM-1927-20]|uniref:hypothetical protein n=1 Tax=Legionella sp. CNM-1927-20 TaxID=3422221 RepID=UPI00403AA12F